KEWAASSAAHGCYIQLERTLLPGTPDCERDTGSLNVDKERFAVGAEGRAWKFLFFESGADVTGEVEDPSLARQPAYVLLMIVPIFADHQASARADADVIGHIEHGLFPRFEDQFESALLVVLRDVLPNLPEFLVAARGRGEEDAVAARAASFEA